MKKLKKKIKWELVARRGKHSLLLIDIMAQDFRDKEVKKFLKASFNPAYYRRLFHCAGWFKKEEWNKYLEILKEKEQHHHGYLLQLAKRFEKRIDDLFNFVKPFYDKDYSKKTNKQLKQLFNQFINKYKKFLAPDYTYMQINRYLPDLLYEEIRKRAENTKQVNQYCKILFGLDKASYIREEKKSILLLAQKIKKKRLRLNSSQVLSWIKNHIKKFGFLGYYYFYKQPYTVKDIQKRLKNLLSKDIEAELKDINEEEKNSQRTAKIIKKLNLDKKIQLIIKTTKKWAWVINYFDETANWSTYHIRGLLEEIASKLRIPYKYLIEMTIDEINQGLEKGETSEKLRRELPLRERGYGYIMENYKVRILVGEALKREEKKEKKIRVYTKVKILKGQPASLGKAEGLVKVVLGHEQIQKVKKGNILVAPATTPIFVPAMEKASAIVTEEGGLLSHAAIVSRELGIPCVVGTKIATKVLKDGDRVEVDATKGVIKKL